MNSSYPDKPRPHHFQLACNARWRMPNGKPPVLATCRRHFRAVPRTSFLRRWVWQIFTPHGVGLRARIAAGESQLGSCWLTCHLADQGRATRWRFHRVWSAAHRRIRFYANGWRGRQFLGGWRLWYYPLPNKDLMAMAVSFSGMRYGKLCGVFWNCDDFVTRDLSRICPQRNGVTCRAGFIPPRVCSQLTRCK